MVQKATSVLETPNILPLGQIQTFKVLVMIFEKMRKNGKNMNYMV